MTMPKDATHYQPHQKAYYMLLGLKWFVWSRVEQASCCWIYSPATQEKYLENIK